MKFLDDNKTAILKDTTILVFEDNGMVKLYPSTKWIAPRNSYKSGYGHCHTFYFDSKEQAIDVFNIIENNIIL